MHFVITTCYSEKVSNVTFGVSSSLQYCRLLQKYWKKSEEIPRKLIGRKHISFKVSFAKLTEKCFLKVLGIVESWLKRLTPFLWFLCNQWFFFLCVLHRLEETLLTTKFEMLILWSWKLKQHKCLEVAKEYSIDMMMAFLCKKICKFTLIC